MNFDNEPWDGGADLPLLYLSMKLITSQPRVGFEAVENYLYTASKRFLSLLESSGTASLLYLQALVLVALYEYGQGIYPAAWMTVGQCVRYADFIGLPSYGESNDVLGQCVRISPASVLDTSKENPLTHDIYRQLGRRSKSVEEHGGRSTFWTRWYRLVPGSAHYITSLRQVKLYQSRIARGSLETSAGRSKAQYPPRSRTLSRASDGSARARLSHPGRCVVCNE